MNKSENKNEIIKDIFCEAVDMKSKVDFFKNKDENQLTKDEKKEKKELKKQYKNLIKKLETIKS
jgi:hypothetical protein